MKCEKCLIDHDGKYGSGRFCSSICSRSYSSNKNKEEKNKKISESLKGKYTGSENSHYKNGNDLNMKKFAGTCPVCKSTFNSSKTKTYCSRKCYLNDTNFEYKTKVSGGYRKGSGIGKKGWYKGYWCDSSWELAFVIYNLENNIIFERNTIGYEYYYKGNKHKYYPDYKVFDTLYEIKGFETDKDKEKYKSIKNLNLKILYKGDIQHMIDYVISKYGKDYIKLYEKDLEILND
jgi:hypothetical protein